LQMLHILEMIPSFFPAREELTGKLNRVVDLFYSLSFSQNPSCHPYLWLAALVLFSSNFGSPNNMARTFFLHNETLARFLKKSKVSERIGNSLPVLFYGQFSLWLSVVLKCEKQIEPVLKKVSEISELLGQQSTRERPEFFLYAFILAMGNHSVEDVIFKLELIRAQLKKSLLERSSPISESFGSLWESLLIIILGVFAGAHYNMGRMNQINQMLTKKHLPLSQKDLELASLFLWFQGGDPKICVKRFMEVGQAFGLSSVQKKASLSDPSSLPKESHPFRKVVSSFVQEFSPVFPFDYSGFLPVALLSALPWKAEDLAWESMELYSYLRSYRRYISPSVSFWIATGLVFSSWEQGYFPEIVLFWTLTGLAILTELQFREEFADTLSFPQV